MPFFYVYKTGFEEFIDKFQTRIDDVFIVGIPRSGKISIYRGTNDNLFM